MNTIDIIIELLDAGKSILDKNQIQRNMEGEFLSEFIIDELFAITEMINGLIGRDHSTIISLYFQGEINIQNAILRLVVDSQHQPLAQLSIGSIYGGRSVGRTYSYTAIGDKG